MGKLRVVFVPVGKSPEDKEIPDTLEALQEAVGGHIEAFRVGSHNGHALIAIVDEEGKLKGKKANLYWRGDALVGDVLLTRSNDEGEFVSLDDEDVEHLMLGVLLARIALGDRRG